MCTNYHFTLYIYHKGTIRFFLPSFELISYFQFHIIETLSFCGVRKMKPQTACYEGFIQNFIIKNMNNGLGK